MGPFNRTAPGVGPDGQFTVGAPEYRRAGHAMATVMVPIGCSGPMPPALACARIRVSAPHASVDIAPALATHEAPGSKREEHRLWFLLDLSQLIFGDSTFSLVVGGSEVALPDPQPRASWGAGEGDGTADMDSAWSESELRALVSALEERCRVAERTAVDLRQLLEGDSHSSEHTSKLTNAWREVEVLQELLDTRESAYRAVKDVLDAAAAERDARDAQINVMQSELERAQREALKRDDALTGEVERARERAADGRRMAEVVASTLEEVQAERQVLLDQAAAAVAELDRERSAREASLVDARPPGDARNLKPQAAAPRRRPRRGLLGRLQSAAGAAGPAHDGIIEQQRATIADLERRLQAAESRAVDAPVSAAS